MDENVLNVYRFLSLISVDVACGAAVCALFFARIVHIQLRFQGAIALATTVWIIYSLDHLLDASRVRKEASTARHFFHQRHFRTMSMLVLIAIVLDIWMLLFVRRQIFLWGAGLAVIVTIYLLVQRWINPFKELIGALLYSGGVLLPALSLNATALSTSVRLLMAIFFLTALINLVLFSWFELEQDQQDKHGSFVTWFGKEKSKLVLVCLFLLQGLLIATLLLQASYSSELLTLLAMNFVLVLVFCFAAKFRTNEGYRLIGDFIFLFPVPYLLWHG